jgi:hypothetical protein
LELGGADGTGVEHEVEGIAKRAVCALTVVFKEVLGSVEGIGDAIGDVVIFHEFAEAAEGGGLSLDTEPIGRGRGDFLADLFDGVVVIAKPGKQQGALLVGGGAAAKERARKRRSRRAGGMRETTGLPAGGGGAKAPDGAGTSGGSGVVAGAETAGESWAGLLCEFSVSLEVFVLFIVVVSVED